MKIIQKKSSLSVIYISFLLLLIFPFSSILSSTALGEGYIKPEQIILTWTADPTTSQTITWLMPDILPAQVQYAMADGFNGNFNSASIIQVQGTAFDNTYYRYQADISGLASDTTYFYRVGSEGNWSDTLSFTTAADTENFSFLYMGDIQSGYVEWGNMLDMIHQSYPQIKFSLMGGDLTDNGYDANEWGQFLDTAAGVFSKIPLMPTLGNHDGEMYRKFFALPSNGPNGLQKEFYSLDYGNAHFVVLNSSNNTSAAVKQWLQEDLQSTTKKWKFAVFHHPAYQAFNDNKTIDDSIRTNWIPILEQNNVDMVFVGHQHEYMRTHPIYQGEVQNDAAAYGIVYVMGNAGSKTYAGGGNFSYIAKEQTGSNYQVISIDGNVMTMTAKKANGELIESYTINKGLSAPSYLTVPVADSAYTAGVNADGISTMTINNGVSGLKYFTVNIQPIHAHTGTETVVFSRYRNDTQVELNAIMADFDAVNTAKAGFNTQAGDVIKVFMVDELSNAIDHNPIIMQ